MSAPLPLLSNPCITAASSTSVYLMGIPGGLGGHLQVFSVALNVLDTLVAVPVGKEQVTNTWAVDAKLACFSYGAITAQQYSSILLVQVGKTQTHVSNLHSSGVFDYPVPIPEATLKSTKLLTQVGAFSTFAWFTGFTTNVGTPWKGMRFLSSNVSAYITDDQMSQSPSMTAFLAVGAYELSTKSPTQGYTIIFDTASSGAAYPATGTGDTHEAVSLSAPISLDMQGITLSPKAIPLTMGSVSYILDEAADTSIVAYAITPSTSNKLSAISIAGKAPSFLSVQTATCLNNKIVIYSVSNSSSPTPSLNVFDAVGRTWSGPGLFGSGASKYAQSRGPTTPVPSGSKDDGSGKFPVAPVVGGISALIVVAFIAFYVHRRRRHRQFKRDNNPPSLSLPPPPAMDDDEDEISEQKLEMDSRLQKHSILTIQEEAIRRTPTYPASPPRKDIWSQPQPPFNPQFVESVPSNPQYR